MMVRFTIALILAMTFLVLGITIRFSDPKPEVDAAVFFEITGELPEVEFEVAGQVTWAPAILCVGSSDPGLLQGTYPGHVLSVEFSDVDPAVFLRSRELFEDIRPGSKVLELRREGIGKLGVGNAELFWVCSIIRSADAEGVEEECLVVGVAVHDEEARFPEEFRAARAMVIPYTTPPGSPPIIGRFTQRALHFEGPLERPTRLTHKITLNLSFEVAEAPPQPGG